MGEGLGTSPGSRLLTLPAMWIPQPDLWEAFNELPEGVKEEKKEKTLFFKSLEDR